VADKRFAPVAVFAYRRPKHLARALDALESCPEFPYSQVYIFSDGARSASCVSDVKAVRAMLRARKRSNMIIVEQPNNRGLASSVIAAVTDLCQKYGRIIVIEDDLVVHKTTLGWLNQGLDAYADDERVMQISAYQYRVPEFEARAEGTFQNFATTWGWATWKRAWGKFDPAATGWQSVKHDPDTRRAFDSGGVYPFSQMLEKQMSGQLDSWGIRWSWAVFKVGGLTLMPPRTLVRNDGFTEAATHNTLGWAKRFALGPVPRPWTKSYPPTLPSTVSVTDVDQKAFRRGLLRTQARRNARIKRILSQFGLTRFR